MVLTGSNVRRVAFNTPCIEELDELEDLTVFHDSCSYFHDVCMISTNKPFNKLFNNLYNCVCFGRNHASIVPHFDMSYSDLDSAWTFSVEDDCKALGQECKTFERDCNAFERDCKMFSVEDGCKMFEQQCKMFEQECKTLTCEDECKSFERDCKALKSDCKTFSVEDGCESLEQSCKTFERDCKKFSVEDDCKMFEQSCKILERDCKMFSFEDDCNMSEQECEMFSLADECKPFETCSHVRAVTAEQMEIVLDSGADVSALPLRFGTIGKSCPQPRDGAFVDAQGGKLNVRDVRIGKVQLGSVSFRERFIIADVTTPLLALGSIVRAGWSLHADGTQQFLCKGDKTVEVLFKRNSLCAMGTISQISETDGEAISPVASPCDAFERGDTEFLMPQQESVRPISGQVSAITLKPSLTSLGPGWNMLTPQLYAISTFGPRHINTTLIPSRELMWLRTTLVKRETGWELDEFAQPISELSNMTAPLPNVQSVLEVITLAHVFAVPPEVLGFNMPEGHSAPRAIDALAPSLPMYRESPVEGHGAVVEVPVEMEVPAADDAEPPEIDRDLPYVAESDLVVIDGVRYNMDSTLKHLREACISLGLSKNGSKKNCFKRLLEHIQHQELIASQSATAKVGSESQRLPIEQKRPEEPSQAAVDAHNLVHEPYAAWCPLCVAHRARQDVHSRRGEQGLRSDHSVVSWDFGFCSRTSDGTDDKLTALYLHDSFTGLLGVVPTPQKGGKYLSYLTTEVTRFIVQTGHSVVGLRCDAEPSTLTLLSSVRKTCQALGIGTHAEPTPVGDHQANGGAEVAVRLLRSHASILVSQVEQACGATEPIVAGNHPFFAWALLHSAWTHNRFKVNGGMTAFETCSGRTYNGRLAMFGERVYAFLKPEQKAKPCWQKGLWLGKTAQGDCHIVSTAAGILVTRSIRRMPKPFELELVGECVVAPWDCGYASLGHRMLYAKRLTQPVPTAIQDFVGATVQPGSPADEAASDPPSPNEVEAMTEMKEPSAEVPQQSEGIFTDVPSVEIPAKAGLRMKPPPSTAVVAAPATPADATGASSSSAPMDLRESPGIHDTEHAESERPEKQLRINAISDVGATPNDSFDDLHEDGKPDYSFSHQELDDLETYELGLDDDGYYDDGFPSEQFSDDAERLLQEVIFPYTKDEPNVPVDELQRLDAIADRIEMIRLKGLGVLCDPSILDGVTYKTLSTRFVRTWRCKNVDGVACWLRRSRFVAREFAWLNEATENLFSPASSAIAYRIIPTMFLKHQSTWGLYAIDIKDAFLTVEQRDPTMVYAQDASGEIIAYSLGRVLPGQRTGSMLWHESLTQHLKDAIGLVECECYPSMLKSKCGQCFILLHVDDLFVTGSKQRRE